MEFIIQKRNSLCGICVQFLMCCLVKQFQMKTCHLEVGGWTMQSGIPMYAVSTKDGPFAQK